MDSAPIRLSHIIPALLAIVFSYSTNGQSHLLNDYRIHLNHLDSLIENQYLEEAIEYSIVTPTNSDEVFALFVQQRNRARLKKHQYLKSTEVESLQMHQRLRGKSDSLSLFLDAKFLELLGHYNYQQSRLYHGLNYLDSATILFKAARDYESAIYNLNMIGTIYDINGDKAKSLQYYRRALDLFQEHPVDSLYYFELMVDFGNLYTSLDQVEEAKQHYEDLYNNPQLAKYPDTRADVLVNLGNIAQLQSEYRDAEHYYLQGLRHFRHVGDSAMVATVLHDLGVLVENTYPLDALQYFQQSFDIKETFLDYEGMASSMYSMSRLYYEQNDISQAEEYSKRALELALKAPSSNILSNIYELLSNLSAERKDWQQAYHYSRIHRNLSDSLLLAEQQAAINKVEQVYHIEEQNELIDNLEKSELKKKIELRKSKVINYALGGATILLIIVLILLMSNFQQMQRTKSTLYTKNLEITAAEALMKGQEDERQRLAHQLHDKVGNYITVLKNHVVTHSGNDETLLQIVKDMSGEVRNISQDLMPPVLERFGLADALEELCTRYRDQMKATIDLNINQSEVIPILQKDQINLYRLVQEIIQVSLFQYNANYMLIDMRWNETGIWVDIEDNGTRKTRSDENDIVYHPWQGIEHRVQFLKGEFKRTSQNHGNEYHIFIPKQII